nr:hypothetical protein GTC16762_31520 [Pigmentibacter ruber]
MGDAPDQIPKNQITINKNTEFAKIEGIDKYRNNEFIFKKIIQSKREI